MTDDPTAQPLRAVGSFSMKCEPVVAHARLQQTYEAPSKGRWLAVQEWLVYPGLKTEAFTERMRPWRSPSLEL